MFTETYILRESSMVELLDQLDKFDTVFSKWQSSYPKYKRDINVQQDENKEWFVEITITKDE